MASSPARSATRHAAAISPSSFIQAASLAKGALL
jgi:hypothetical protein